jgi:hypothetical protein
LEDRAIAISLARFCRALPPVFLSTGTVVFLPGAGSESIARNCHTCQFCQAGRLLCRAFGKLWSRLAASFELVQNPVRSFCQIGEFPTQFDRTAIRVQLGAFPEGLSSQELVCPIVSRPARLVALCSFCSSDQNNMAMRVVPACIRKRLAELPYRLLRRI